MRNALVALLLAAVAATACGSPSVGKGPPAATSPPAGTPTATVAPPQSASPSLSRARASPTGDHPGQVHLYGFRPGLATAGVVRGSERDGGAHPAGRGPRRFARWLRPLGGLQHPARHAGPGGGLPSERGQAGRERAQAGPVGRTVPPGGKHAAPLPVHVDGGIEVAGVGARSHRGTGESGHGGLDPRAGPARGPLRPLRASQERRRQQPVTGERVPDPAHRKPNRAWTRHSKPMVKKQRVGVDVKRCPPPPPDLHTHGQ